MKRIDLDQIVIDAAQRAASFVVVIYCGRDLGRARVPAATLVEARKVAAQMEHIVANGRRAMIYAVSPEGAGTFIPFHLDGRINS